MAYSGGTYTRTNGTNSGANLWVADRDAGTKITAVNHDLHDEDIATALSSCLLKDGTQTVTANVPMATYKFTGLGAGSAATDSANLGQVQASAYSYVATDTGAGDAYVIAPTPAITAYAAGQKFSFVAANASTGASTVNVSGLGTKAIEYQGAALAGAEIAAGSTIKIEYDGTAFQMVSPSNLLSSAAGDLLAANNLSDVAVAATALANIGGIGSLVADTTPQLGGFLDVNGNYMQTEKGGDIASASPLVIDTDGDYFDVTGTTGFAAMTVAADRQFTLQFDGALTMTHHATNLDLPGEANITTAAGDVAVFQSTGANTVQCISYTKADGTAVVSTSSGLTLGTEQATTSGASVTFGSIPSGTKMITLNLYGVSDTGTGAWTMTLGDSGGLEATGYVSDGHRIGDTTVVKETGITTAFLLGGARQSAEVFNGTITLMLEDSANNTWIMNAFYSGDTETTIMCTGSKSLSGELTQLSFLAGGNFDAGAVNISYQ